MCIRNLVLILKNHGYRLFQEIHHGRHHAAIMGAIRVAIMGTQRVASEDAYLCLNSTPGQVYMTMEMLKEAVRRPSKQVGVMVVCGAPTQDAAADGCRIKLIHENWVN